MTSPGDPAARDYAAALRRIEDAARAQSMAKFVQEVDELLKRAVASTALSSDAFRGVSDRLRDVFDGVPALTHAAITQAIDSAWAQGLASVADQLGMADPEGLSVARRVEQPDVRRLVLEQQASALAMLRSNDDIVPALQLARRSVTRVDRAASWYTHQTAAAAVDASAISLGLSVRWVAERDACLHCLAYAGETTQAGAPFRGGLTFADEPLSTDPVRAPLHVHCRCLTQVHDPADEMVVQALKREARRSIAKGWSLPSESQAERLRATDRLLRQGAGLPASVEKAAKKAVKDGSFS